ncbi:MAG: histidine phosphatase family protein [Alphaproteobacteria bacterium]|nr:MAG: histidine phosphatase family protein [Alphaproteobacteria bacterium]
MTKEIRIHLVRHGKPNISRDVWLTRRQYIAWWASYTHVGLDPNDAPRSDTQVTAQECPSILSSSLKRAVETAEILADGKPIASSELFVEAPLPPLWIFGWLKAKPIAWGTLSRITWWMGFSAGQESHWQAKQRAWNAVDELSQLAQEHGDVMLCGHGWFNRMIAKRLRQSGWKRSGKGGDAYWTCRTMVMVKEDNEA